MAWIELPKSNDSQTVVTEPSLQHLQKIAWNVLLGTTLDFLTHELRGQQSERMFPYSVHGLIGRATELRVVIFFHSLCLKTAVIHLDCSEDSNSLLLGSTISQKLCWVSGTPAVFLSYAEPLWMPCILILSVSSQVKFIKQPPLLDKNIYINLSIYI